MKNLRGSQVAQDFDIGQDAMAADDAREVFHRRKEVDFFVERNDFVIILTQFITVAFYFLSLRNYHPKVGRFCEFG